MRSLIDSLSRTLLLMRDEFGLATTDGVLLKALTNTRIALIADSLNVASYSAQSAFVALAMLMGRSGHKVFLMAPDIRLVGPQPPLPVGSMIDSLPKVGKDLLPGVEFVVGAPEGEVDLAIALGDSPIQIRAQRKIRLNADAWTGMLLPEERAGRWRADMWPIGALAAAGLGAGEAFKLSMIKLCSKALSPPETRARFALTDETYFELAPAGASTCNDLERLDFVSGGAITNATLYCLARIPAVRGNGKIIEPDYSDRSNLNRNMLLLRSGCRVPKAIGLVQTLGNSGLKFKPVLQRYEPSTAISMGRFAPTVVVGVDHIPTRWAVQEAAPEWLAIGATTHWSAMASFHTSGLGCARCLHNQDDPNDGLIPTTACVSFWAGLLTATYIARRAAGHAIPVAEQQMYLTPFRPENLFVSSVAIRSTCPTCQRSLAA